MSDRPRPASADTARDVLLVFIVASFAYLALRSKFYIGDGVRWLRPMLIDGAPASLDGGNSHFLPPYIGWLTSRFCVALGFPLLGGDGPVLARAIGLFQGLSAVAAGAGLSLVYLWIREVASRRAAIPGILVAGCSHAFLLHATDMTEPMMAVPPMMLGLLIAHRFPDRVWARLVAGALIGLAADVYQLALLSVVPAGIVNARRAANLAVPAGFLRLARAGVEIGLASVATYVLVITSVRFATTPGSSIATILGSVHKVQTAGGMFGSLNPKHFLAGVFGFANSLFELPTVPGGMSRLARQPMATLLTVVTVTLLALAFVGGLGHRLWLGRERLIANGRVVDVLASLVWFALVAAAACYWFPLYEKFWLFSSPPLALLVALAADTRREGIGSGGQAPLFLVPAAILLVLNLVTRAIPRHFDESADVNVALRISAIVQPEDLLVCGGWDGPSVYLRTILKRPGACFDLTDLGLERASHPGDLSRELTSDVTATRARGGHVYFLGLLGDSRAQWEEFFGNRVHLPFEMLDPYRSNPVALETLKGSEAELVLYEAPASPP